jgi:small conductance mechanosensitive channel
MPEPIRKALDGLSEKLQGWLEVAVAMTPNFVLALIVLALAAVAARYAGRLVRRSLARVTDNGVLIGLSATVARIAIFALGLFAALSLLHLERTVTSMLAGIGVVGLALGFAFQDIAANFMSGVFLALRGPFVAGDVVEADGRLGVVTEVQLRRTVLRSFDGLTVIIPNKLVVQQTLINYTRSHQRRVELSLGVAYGDDLERARAAVIAALDDLEYRDPQREAQVFFKEFGSSSINFDVHFWLAESAQDKFLEARSEAVIRIKRGVDQAGLTIPFPIRTLDFGAEVVGGASFDSMQLRVAGIQNSAPGAGKTGS